MLKLILIAAVIGFILLGVGITHFLEKKQWLPNRWLTGSLVFLVILIPSIILPQLPLGFKQLFYGISALLAVIFFETTRRILERNEYKGNVKTQPKGK
ncbi:hypothetical protein GIX45_27280 [Erwinia sp. CPCC 100877]|nr:hypothetical protein [Erwinia sp. CPCC 100877]